MASIVKSHAFNGGKLVLFSPALNKAKSQFSRGRAGSLLRGSGPLWIKAQSTKNGPSPRNGEKKTKISPALQLR